MVGHVIIQENILLFSFWIKVPAQAKIKDFYFPQFVSYHVPKHSYLIEISILGQNTHE